MLSEFLTRVLCTSSLQGGCGMSARPGFYSGRGATLSDLDSARLEKIWTAIRDHAGEAAAGAFVQMVDAMPSLSATDFLLTLARLEARDWQWSPDLLGSERGICAEDMGSAWGTVLEALGCSERVDQTEAIRGRFLCDRGVHERRDVRDWLSYSPHKT